MRSTFGVDFWYKKRIAEFNENVYRPNNIGSSNICVLKKSFQPLDKSDF